MVIDHLAKERKMEDLTIKSCKNNVRTYLSKRQEMRNEIDSLCKYRINYNKQQFLTLTSKDLGKKAGDILSDVRRQRS